VLAPRAACARTDPAAPPPHTIAIADNAGLDRLRASFNRSADSLRIILLLSPTNGVSVQGARAVDSLLERHPEAQTRVFAVWERALWTDWHATSTATPSVIGGPRVSAYWDPGCRVSRAILKTRPKEPGPRVWLWGTLWDYVAVIPPGVRWDQAFPETEFSGGPIIKVIDHVENRLKPAEAD
jgi:hypothetical protein